MKKHLLFTTALLTCSGLSAETVVKTEQIGTARGDWNQPAWAFKTIHRPSRSDAALGAKVTISGSRAQASCLAPDSLCNGVMPQQTRLHRDFFTFENGSPGGLIVMDLGKVIPIAEINSYNKQGALLGQFRRLVWQVKRTDRPGTKPNYTNTWFAELDVHTPETLAKAGDFIPAGSQLKEIVVAYKSHFDIGFTHPAPEIVDIYRTSMIDRALDLIDGSKDLPEEQRFVWTIPSWVLWQILWPGQDPGRRARIVKAVKDGSLVIHALPVTLHTESLDLDGQLDCNHLDSVYGTNGKACYGWNTRADLPHTPDYTSTVAAYTSMSVRKDAVGQSAELSAPAAGIIASKVTTTITLPHHTPWLEITTRLDDKQPDYWPENGAMVFPVNAEKPQFRLARLGGVVDPAVDFARGSNRTYGIVNNGAMIAGADGSGVAICPLDHGMMSFGDKGLNTIDPDYVPTTPVARVSLFNNLWTINFPYWISGTIHSRVRVWATADLEPASVIEPALDAHHPVLTAIATGPAGKLPATAGGLSLSRKGVGLTCFAPNRDGEGTVLRVWEQTGVSGDLTVTLPGKFTTATPVNLRGKPAGPPIPINDGKFTIPLRAYAPASFILL